MQPSADFVIVGAGPVGLVCALLLSRQGYRSQLFEGRSDPRRAPRTAPGRSISFTITTRGWRALREAGVEEPIRRAAIPLRGRMIHLEGGTHFQPYGAANESIDCVGRTAFVSALLHCAEQDPNISIAFDHRCLGYQRATDSVLFEVSGQPEPLAVPVTRVIAADGVHSAVRRSFADDEETDFSVRHSRHFYREVTIAAGQGTWPFDPQALHIWPREDCLLVGFPNPQRGQQFTGTLFLPLDGPLSFNALGRPADVRAYFARTFPDLAHLTPHLADEFFAGPPANLISMKCRPWIFVDRIALIGDAAHAMVPFLGQGLNAGLEDAQTLAEAVRRAPNAWSTALEAYELARKPSCDAVTDLAEQHYRELALDARHPDFVWRKQVESKLVSLLPNHFATTYSIISFSERPYVEVAQIARTQRRLVDEVLGLPNLAERWETPELDQELRTHALRVLTAPSEPPAANEA